MKLVIRLASVAASAAFTFGSFAVTAQADEVPADPCASQQAKVDKATAALARVTAVFARQQERVEAKREDVAEAGAGTEKAAARHALKAAKDALKEAKVTHRAQQVRLVKATERLTACQAEQPPATEAPATA